MSSTITPYKQRKALFLSTVLFALTFATWTLFSILGIEIKQTLELSDSQFGILVATPVLTGAISRLFLGALTDQIGGRKVFIATLLVTAGSTWCIALVQSYHMYLLVALGVGLAGGTFSIGVAYEIGRAHV